MPPVRAAPTEPEGVLLQTNEKLAAANARPELHLSGRGRRVVVQSASAGGEVGRVPPSALSVATVTRRITKGRVMTAVLTSTYS